MPGYDITLFKNLSNSEADELICPICSCIFKDPIVTQCCRQTYCNECINEWLKGHNTCPNDRKTLSPSDLSKPPRNFNNMLDNLVIKCSFSGCVETLPLEKLEQHSRECLYNPEGICNCGEKIGNRGEHNCFENLKSRIKIIEKNNDHALKRNNELESRLRSIEKLRDYTSKEKSALEKENKKLIVSLDQMRKENENFNKIIDQLRKEDENSKKIINQLRIENQNFKKENEFLKKIEIQPKKYTMILTSILFVFLCYLIASYELILSAIILFIFFGLSQETYKSVFLYITKFIEYSKNCWPDIKNKEMFAEIYKLLTLIKNRGSDIKFKEIFAVISKFLIFIMNHLSNIEYNEIFTGFSRFLIKNRWCDIKYKLVFTGILFILLYNTWLVIKIIAINVTIALISFIVVIIVREIYG
jgi:hypothetical protein